MVETKFKQTDVGLIPEDWEVAEFGDVLRFLPTNTLPRELLCDKGTFKNIHYGDVLIKYGSVLDVSNTPIPCIDSSRRSSYHPKCLAQDGDIIIADTAEDETVCKATELWNIGSLKIVSGMHTMWCRPQKRIFAVKYLGYFINSCTFHNQILSLIQGIKVSSVSKRDIQRTWLIVPIIAEQERIASALTSIDNLISSLDKQIAKTRNIKQGAMQQLLTFPDNVPLRPLGEISEMQRGTAITKKNVKKGEIPVIAGGQTPAYFCDMSNRDGETITIAGSGEYAGYVAYWNKPIFVSDAFSIKGTKLCITKYLYFVLRGMQSKIHATKKGAGVPHVIISSICDFAIPVPSIEEQQRIASTLTAMDNQIAALEAKRRKYEMLKQGMMQQLLTGKIRLSQ